MNDRGQYGGKRSSGLLPVAIVAALTAGIIATSPGARYWYRHGRLPDERR